MGKRRERMKRLLQFVIALSLCVAVASPAFGQEEASPWRLGVHAGAAYSNLNGDVLTSSDATWGPYAGATAEYFFANSFSVGFEANYLQKGGNNVAFTLPPRDVSTSYIELPLTAGYIFEMAPDWNGRIYTGIDVAFLLSCNVSSSDQEESCDDSTLVPNAKSTEWSIPFGVQLGYDLSGSTLALDLRYSLGLSSTFSTSGAGSNLKSRSWQFKLMWFFLGGE